MTGDQRTEALARLRAELVEGGLIEGRDDGPPPEVPARGIGQTLTPSSSMAKLKPSVLSRARHAHTRLSHAVALAPVRSHLSG